MKDPFHEGALKLASWSERENTLTPLNVHFSILEQRDVPLSVSDLSVRNDAGRETSDLLYTIQNAGDSNVSSASLIVLFFNDRNEPLGGEMFRETLNLSPNGKVQMRTSLKHFVDSGQRVSIAVRAYVTDIQSWHADDATIIEAIKNQPLQ